VPPSSSKPEGEKNSDKKNRFLQFWTTLPGILTGLAALLTAIVAVFGVWRSAGDGSGGGGSEGVSAATIESRAANPGASTTAAINGGTQPEGVLIQSHLAMMDGDFADLEKARIEVSHNADLAFEAPQLLAQGSGFLAPASAAADKAGCVHDLTARHDFFIWTSALGVGSLICVNTVEGNVAALTIVGLPGVGTSELVFDYTVWK
jgi:hypothetical protein